ncbi:MAG: efflux RND transporter permease subunit [SAR324 cluster bacterium]|jgi:multidrug efflux pump subunit AcrB|nr:efflux RND transporter permease subunit [SAR324 cluster bacterium]|tara:strand:+ start:11969 stop:15148 length:3180 start_codon:yes stop_codon:yes gene_type:complete
MHPSHIAIRNPVFIFIIVLIISLWGYISYRQIPREAAPDIQIPLLIVTIPFPGASPEDVESLITNKAEQELQTIKNLKEIKSTSSEGVSALTLEFTSDFDITEARTKVREKMDLIKPDFPDDAEDYSINEINLSEQPLMILNLAGEMGLLALTNLADEVKEEIEGIPGILEVRRAGGLEKEIRVYVNPDKLNYYSLDLNQVSTAISSENTNLPGGSVEMGPTKYLIRVPGEFETPDGINEALISAPDQVPVRVRDVARVIFGYKETSSKSRLDGYESVSLSIIKRSGENLLAIRDSVIKIVTELEGKYEGDVKFSILSDAGKRVQKIVTDLENNIISGFILVFLVLLLVMGISNSLLVATAIPLSFLVSIILMNSLGYTLNIVVLFSLILSLGLLVDNAIVVVENIYRHRQAGKKRVEAAMIGVKEIAVPVMTSTITTVAAFFPLIFMPGIAGEFIKFLPKTLIITLSSSLFVAMLINPVLCSTLMRVKTRKGITPDFDELKLVDQSRILRGYRWLLKGVLKWRFSLLFMFLILFVGIFYLYGTKTFPRKGIEFFPKTEPEEAVVNITAPMGTTLEVSDRYVRKVEGFLEGDMEKLEAVVANVGQRRGFGGSSSGSTTTYLSHIVLAFPNWEEWIEKPSVMIKELRRKLDQMAGVEVKLSQAQAGPPTGMPLNIEVRGEDFTQMILAVEDIKQRIKNVPGLVDLTDDFDRSRPELKVMIDRDKASRLGLRAREIASTVRTAFNGKKVSVFRDGTEEYEIWVQLDQSFRQNQADLASLFIFTPTGELVRLSEIATVDSGPSYGSIRHVDTDRAITISGDAFRIPGPVLVKLAQKALAGLNLPDGVSMRFTGENEDRQETQKFIGQALIIAIFLILLVMIAQFNSIAIPLIVITSVFMSIMGVLIGLIIHDRPFGIIMTGVGTVALAGIVVNNAIVMLDFVKQLRKQGFTAVDAMVTAAAVRFRPVMLTAITTILGLAPLAIGMDIDFTRDTPIIFGAEGGSFWKSMALAIMYGLGVATFLTLFMVPVLYSLIESARSRISRIFKMRKPFIENAAENPAVS